MTDEQNKERQALNRLADAFADDILGLSDEEILAEFTESHGDPAKNATDMRALFEKTERRLKAAQAAVAAARRPSAPMTATDIAGARQKLRRFNKEMQDRQLAWACSGGITPVSALEERHGKISCVLKPEHRKLNLFRPAWWDYIVGKEHRWARALNSSQCFAVNLFAPLADDRARARAALQILLRERALEAHDVVDVRFEVTPTCAAKWLGESGQPTQIDVYFQITRSDRKIGYLLVEVKFSEPRFAGCRGWGGKSGTSWTNPDRSRCCDVSKILSAPETNCWMAEVEGRRYWEIMSRSESSIHVEAIRSTLACPFRHGLYQMMRNRVLADELVRRSGAEWADFAVCLHPGNQAVVTLDEPVSSTRNVIDAFRSLSSDQAVLKWNAKELLATIRSTDKGLEDWESWMCARYFANEEI